MSDKILNDPRVLDDEDLVQLCEIRKHLPFKTSPATVNRWIRKGARGVVLATAMGGSNRRYTSTRAIREFLIAIQGDTAPIHNNIGMSPCMSKRELKSEMRRLGLRPQSEPSQSGKPQSNKSVSGKKSKT